MLLPSALGFSPHPPVSVYGTGILQAIAAFLGSQLTCFPTCFRSASRLRIVRRICLSHSYLACTGLSIPGSRSLSASTQFFYMIVQEFLPVVLRPRLAISSEVSTYPEQISFSLETFDIWPEGFPPPSRYSFLYSLFLTVPCSFRYRLVQLTMLLFRSAVADP